jgi:hypothetical protein
LKSEEMTWAETLVEQKYGNASWTREIE